MRLTLDCPLADVEALSKAADGRGKMASVSKRTLSRLLVDHVRLINAYKAAGGEIEERNA
jgi:hypothetical protein